MVEVGYRVGLPGDLGISEYFTAKKFGVFQNVQRIAILLFWSSKELH